MTTITIGADFEKKNEVKDAIEDVDDEIVKKLKLLGQDPKNFT